METGKLHRKERPRQNRLTKSSMKPSNAAAVAAATQAAAADADIPAEASAEPEGPRCPSYSSALATESAHSTPDTPAAAVAAGRPGPPAVPLRMLTAAAPASCTPVAGQTQAAALPQQGTAPHTPAVPAAPAQTSASAPLAAVAAVVAGHRPASPSSHPQYLPAPRHHQAQHQEQEQAQQQTQPDYSLSDRPTTRPDTST